MEEQTNHRKHLQCTSQKVPPPQSQTSATTAPPQVLSHRELPYAPCNNCIYVHYIIETGVISKERSTDLDIFRSRTMSEKRPEQNVKHQQPQGHFTCCNSASSKSNIKQASRQLPIDSSSTQHQLNYQSALRSLYTLSTASQLFLKFHLSCMGAIPHAGLTIAKNGQLTDKDFRKDILGHC